MMFELRNVIKSYGNRKALDVKGLHIPGQRITAAVGPNGAGKSTMLRIIAFLLTPESGGIYFQEKKVNHQGAELREIRRKVTLVEQNPFIFRGSVFSNVAYGLRVRGVPGRERKPRVEDALERVGLEGFEGRDARGLSGGELQRLALARALVLKPLVLLLDEPTAHVDSKRTASIENLILDLHKESNLTVVFATHDMAQANRLTDKIIALDSGVIINQ